MWDEQTFDVEIRVDGPMASAWAPYVFYRGDTLSHCGVNAIEFARTKGQWTIVHWPLVRANSMALTPQWLSVSPR